MSRPGGLALVLRQKSIDRLPPDYQILPLKPILSVMGDRLLGISPESLMEQDDERAIEASVEEIVQNWWRGRSSSDDFTWRGVNLAECFEYELEFIVRDMVKSAWILDRALEVSRAEEAVTDVPPLVPPVLAYPYLAALGSVLNVYARMVNFPVRNLAQPSAGRGWNWRSVVGRLYGAAAARQALVQLRQKRPLLAIGPQPRFYLPLAESWRKTGSSTIVAVPSSSVIRANPKAGFFVLPFEALVTRRDRAEIRTFLDMTMGALRTLSFRGPMEQRGIDLSPVLREYVMYRFGTELATLTAVGIAYERGLNRAQHLVLVGTGSAVGKAALRYASREGIPSTVLQPGVIAGASIYRRTEGDRIAAWGAADADWSRANFGRPVWVEPTGSPQYDHIHTADSVASIHSLARLPPHLRIVLYASQPFVQDRALRSPWERFTLLSMVLDAARRPQGCILLIKWHPSERPETLSSFKERIGSTLLLQFHRENTWALIRASHIVLTLSSTVALEAMFLERPVIFLGPPDRESPFRPPESGAGLRANTREELSRFIERLLTDGSYRERVLDGQRAFLAEHYAPLDGRASERVVAFLERAEG